MSFPVKRSRWRPGFLKNWMGTHYFFMDEFSNKTACVTTRKMKILEKFLDEFDPIYTMILPRPSPRQPILKKYFIFRISKTIAPVKESNRTHRRDIDENEPLCYLIPTGWSYWCDRAELTLYLLCKPVHSSARNSHSIK